MASKGQKFKKTSPETKKEILKKYFDDGYSPIESWHGILKKETLYNNNITSLEHYIQLVVGWIEFYNTTRIKNRNL